MDTAPHPLRYFAYGSNTSTEQMLERCPGAGDPVPAVLRDHAWLCNERGVATIVPVAGREVHGVVWRVTEAHLERLDVFEGVAAGRYRRSTVTVHLATGEPVETVVYIDDRAEPGPPREGYLERVLAGAQQHRLPTTWCDYLAGWANAPRSPARRPVTETGPQTLADLLAHPGVAERSELRSSFGFMAIHGGALEAMTDVIAAQAAARAGASYYGVTYPVALDHHLPSTSYQPHESPTLARFLDHVEFVVSMHGYGRRGRWTSIMAGGMNRVLADHVADHVHRLLPDYEVVTRIDDIPRELRGQHPRNPVNHPAGSGVQLELPPRVRGLSPLSPPLGDDGLSPPTRALIDALAAAAASWAGRPDRAQTST